VYFAVEDFTETEYLLANGYLSYVYAEHFIATGHHRSGEYCRMCRTNLHITLARMPLLMPATMESIAALALGVRWPHFISDSKIHHADIGLTTVLPHHGKL
jgi:hypothetical protein